LALHIAIVQGSRLLLESGSFERGVISNEVFALVGAGSRIDPLSLGVLLLFNVALPNVLAILLKRLSSKEVVALRCL
jgi:hypothetical protein